MGTMLPDHLYLLLCSPQLYCSIAEALSFLTSYVLHTSCHVISAHKPPSITEACLCLPQAWGQCLPQGSRHSASLQINRVTSFQLLKSCFPKTAKVQFRYRMLLFSCSFSFHVCFGWKEPLLMNTPVCFFIITMTCKIQSPTVADVHQLDTCISTGH